MERREPRVVCPIKPTTSGPDPRKLSFSIRRENEEGCIHGPFANLDLALQTWGEPGWVVYEHRPDWTAKPVYAWNMNHAGWVEIVYHERPFSADVLFKAYIEVPVTVTAKNKDEALAGVIVKGQRMVEEEYPGFEWEYVEVDDLEEDI